MNNELFMFATANGLTTEADIAYGEVNGYTVAFSGSKYRLNVCICAIIKDEALINHISHMVRILYKKSYSYLSFKNEHYGLRFEFSSSTPLQRIMKLLVEMTEMLKQNGIKDSKFCAYCGEEIQNYCSYIYIDHYAIITHSTCANELHDSLDKIRSKKQSFGGVLLSFLGSFLGALAGAIPWIIIAVFGYFYFILAAVIALGSEYGYKLFKGKNNRYKTPIIIINTIAGALLGTTIVYFIELSQILGTSSLNVLFTAFKYVASSSGWEFYSNYLLTLAVGIGASFIYTSGFNKEQKLSIPTLLRNRTANAINPLISENDSETEVANPNNFL